MPIIDWLILAFSVNAPIQVIITMGQWLLISRFLNPTHKSFTRLLLCLLTTYISAYLIALIIWLFWPLDIDLILYHNRISIPAVIGEIIAIPIWLYWFHYIGLSSKKIPKL